MISGSNSVAIKTNVSDLLRIFNGLICVDTNPLNYSGLVVITLVIARESRAYFERMRCK